MTQSDSTAIGLVPEMIVAGTQELIAQAKKLGLTWDMRIATVIKGSVPTSVIATIDGDLTPISMVSLVGALTTDSRVYVIVTPPAGYFIVGWAGLPKSFDVDGDVEIDGNLTVNGIIKAFGPPSSSSAALEMNHGYTLFVDNTGPGSANSRVWLNGPDGGATYIGPRAGGSFFSHIYLRTNATIGSAANCNIDATTGQIRRATSSLRYKINVRDADIDLDKVLQLRPVIFQDKSEHQRVGDSATWHTGFIAEEVHELDLHEFVAYVQDDNGDLIPDGVQYDRIIPSLINIIKDLRSKITDLESRVTQLESID